MKKYTTLYFDVDNTLLDFSAAEHDAIKQLFSEYELPNDDKTIKLYSEINDKYWKKCETGEMKKSEILVARFKETLSLLGFERNAEEMNKRYFVLLSNQHFLIDGAIETLSYLKAKEYKIYATTNGLSLTQFKRIKESGLEPFFNGIFVSEKIGFQKPSPEYFKYITEHTPEKNLSKILVIGDSLSSDIKGGIAAGIDTCWYDAYGEKCIVKSTYTVKSLKELKKIL